ncbi:hypothetical protein PC129_g20347 [Phytophthora cactorum]|uniref:Uncharacterized protein n=1 Tax=Phytophthora cactorum TaxID=29920 RepID=A0A329RC13_9STRA|nr:hypothetical protein Pcac1_g16289 [Phytophthora cactorum]KAG2798934.1 hypothetical protein PC112_g21136 [Phytophthora cactorum]KAG2806074.1 hypothetical protein PC111_g17529 [Phytophthora cactorum]KAG2851314.1 hypothetical protein PC113_g16014 [Phytophthora cactorum]KAG2886067.1 hypothetical protein PC115_g20782 [Phytophthora cactorum]
MDDEAHSDCEPRGNCSDYRQQCYADSGDESGYGSEDSQYVSGEQSDDYRSDGGDRYLAAANDTERRTATNGTYGRRENRTPRGDGADRGRERESRYPGQANRDDHYYSRNERNGRRQYGPCAVCGGISHSAHYCRRRCKLCKQMHDAGKCEVFQNLADLDRTKVDKKDLPPENQSLLFNDHLN